jgi:gamma-glutamyltranspeptidase/glutathione hydrolase
MMFTNLKTDSTTMKLRNYLFSFIILASITNPAKAQVGWTKSYEKAVVVTAEKRASEAGKQILQQGGNAVDAAVAVQFALAVTLPRAGNIGGGGFMVIHLSDGTNTTLDYREQAPAKAGPDMYIRDGEYVQDLSREGVLAVGVPGVVDGMVKALEKHGTLPLETVMDPAIKLAKEGYALSWMQAQTMNNYVDVLKKYKGSKKYFTEQNGEPFKEGDLFVQKDLAETLERIAQNGRKGFYAGPTAEMIVKEMEQQNGLISSKDLQNYESKWRKPVEAEFHGYELLIMPPPSSGSIAIAQILEMMEPYDLKEMGVNSADYIHLVTEAMRRAFADRAYFMGDPDYVDIPRDTLLSESYNKRRMGSYDENKATSSDSVDHGEIPSFRPESSETTHFSIVDSAGNAVAVTTTLNGSFGSKVAVNGAGFMLNNEMDDFTAKPGEPNMFGLIQGKANAIEPGKRMLSSMSPAIVTKNDSVSMVLGAAGGPRIITATMHCFLNMAVFGMNAAEAMSAPRFHHQWLPDEIYYDPYGISKDTREKLEAMGHTFTETSIGRAHIIRIDEDGMRHGAPDPRGDGAAEGY